MNPLLPRWQSDSSKAIALRELLNHPVMQEALEVLVEGGLPQELVIPEGIDFAIFNATQQTRNEGYFKFRRDLLALTVVAGPRPTAPPSRAWEHLAKDDERKEPVDAPAE